jgi:hypothetical protein
MEQAMTNIQSSTRSKIIAAALTAVTLTGALAITSNKAHAGSGHFGVGLGIGLVTGALVGAAASHAHVAPVYVDRECYFKRRYNKWGKPYLIKVCNYY